MWLTHLSVSYFINNSNENRSEKWMSQDLDTGLFGAKNCLLILSNCVLLFPFALRLRDRVKKFPSFPSEVQTLDQIILKCMTSICLYNVWRLKSPATWTWERPNSGIILVWNAQPACHTYFLGFENSRSISMKETKLNFPTRTWQNPQSYYKACSRVAHSNVNVGFCLRVLGLYTPGHVVRKNSKQLKHACSGMYISSSLYLLSPI